MPILWSHRSNRNFFHSRENEVASFPTIFLLVHLVRTGSHSQQLNVNNSLYLIEHRPSYVYWSDCMLRSTSSLIHRYGGKVEGWEGDEWEARTAITSHTSTQLPYTLWFKSPIMPNYRRIWLRTIFPMFRTPKIFLIEKLRPVDLNLSITLTSYQWGAWTDNT